MPRRHLLFLSRQKEVSKKRRLGENQSVLSSKGEHSHTTPPDPHYMVKGRFVGSEDSARGIFRGSAALPAFRDLWWRTAAVNFSEGKRALLHQQAF